MNFQTTCWPEVTEARDGVGDSKRDALNKLCARYWIPLYVYLLKSGRSREDAQDSVQGFLAYFVSRALIEKVDPSRGRFRRYVLACLGNWLSNERRLAAAEFRGGGRLTLRFDFQMADQLVASMDGSPEEVFRRAWALEIMREANRRMRSAIVAPKYRKARYQAEIKAVIRETAGPGADMDEELEELFRGLKS